MSILNAPSHITSLATSAVLIDLRMSLYTLSAARNFYCHDGYDGD